ncbi:DNA polymerase-3 subunit chi [Inhella inkyongensis]|uniref:DNA polymerase-3 subunit chi n=1 Tax=Inhella inkyongensis TaxID=392593 RepID=A0A840S547_9BURK|nr:DNA polymerase III subunit chi [Inhella inkyongensis]MBB5205515.1 DNA polymerase-3 subunit chi [Inhella inkyongensis]
MGMGRVRFFTGLEDATEYAARLLRKACTQGQRVQVLGPQDRLRRIERAVLQLPGFLPLAVSDASASVRRRSRICLLERFESGSGNDWVILNLQDEAFGPVDDVNQVIELVEDEPQAVQQGRRRFKAYQAQGQQPEHLVLGAPS